MQPVKVQRMFTSSCWMNVWFLIVIGSLVGCGRTEVQTLITYPGELPKPDRVLVYDFALKPDDVSLDGAIGKKLVHLMEGGSKTKEEVEVGRAVANVLSENLVKEIRDLGLPVERTRSGFGSSLSTLKYI